MNKIYLFFFIVGCVGLVFVLLFGITGMYSLNLGFLAPLLFKHQADEREIQLSYKNYSQVFMLLLIIFVNVYILNSFVDLGNFFAANWLGLLISTLFILLGLNGLRLLKNE
jgi:predicted membrane protein